MKILLGTCMYIHFIPTQCAKSLPFNVFRSIKSCMFNMVLSFSSEMFIENEKQNK